MLIGAIYVLIARLLTSIWAPGWTLILIAPFFLGGMTLLCLGIIGEYAGRIDYELKRRPLYVFTEAFGFQKEMPK